LHLAVLLLTLRFQLGILLLKLANPHHLTPQPQQLVLVGLSRSSSRLQLSGQMPVGIL
jgi:hypothetical protein